MDRETQVAYALRHAPEELQLPWYRVITASGKLAFEQGSAAFSRQRDLLADEGVTMLRGKVDMDTYRWQPDLDELLWKPTSVWDET